MERFRKLAYLVIALPLAIFSIIPEGFFPCAVGFVQGNVEALQFEDAFLESEVREDLNKSEGPLTICDIVGDTRLTANQRGIASLNGIQPWTHLRSFTIDNNWISDLSPLSGLTNLETLFMRNNRIEDIGPLKGLSKLEVLGVGSNMISNLGPLTGLNSLTHINLTHNNLTDITPLASVEKLERLYLNGNKIVDLTPLLKLEHLEVLTILDNAFGPDDAACTTHIPALRERGVKVEENNCAE